MTVMQICGVLEDGDVVRVPEHDLRNSWLGAAFVWGKLFEKYFGPCQFDEDYKKWSGARERARLNGVDVAKDPEWEEYDYNGWRRSWTLARSPKISEADWCVLLASFDGFILPKAHFAHAVRCLREFHKEFPAGHMGACADVIEALERDGYAGFCVNATSVNSNPWWIRPTRAERAAMEARAEETGNEDELAGYDGRAYNVNTDTQNQKGTKHWFFDPTEYATREAWVDTNP